MDCTWRQWLFFLFHSVLVCAVCTCLTLIEHPLSRLNLLGYPYFLYSSAYLFRYFTIRNRQYHNAKTLKKLLVQHSLSKNKVRFHFYVHSVWMVQAFSITAHIENKEVLVEYLPLFTKNRTDRKILKAIEKQFMEYINQHPDHKLKSMMTDYKISIHQKKTA